MKTPSKMIEQPKQRQSTPIPRERVPQLEPLSTKKSQEVSTILEEGHSDDETGEEDDEKTEEELAQEIEDELMRGPNFTEEQLQEIENEQRRSCEEEKSEQEDITDDESEDDTNNSNMHEETFETTEEIPVSRRSEEGSVQCKKEHFERILTFQQTKRKKEQRERSRSRARKTEKEDPSK